ncbi:MAG: hypothetical protein H7Y37_17450 [Anaerolineae bacterium]|nr:hypothetical protein [Gloeobacterales cyanobacterium ES-bin-313]
MLRKSSALVRVVQTLLLSTDSLFYCLQAGCLKAAIQLGGGSVSVTRLVLDALQGDRRELERLSHTKQLRILTLDPAESKVCTQLWIEGWPPDIASLIPLASAEEGILVYAGAAMDALEWNPALPKMSCTEMLFHMVVKRIISLNEADHFLLRMREMGLDSPVSAIDFPTLQQWQRRDLHL